MLRILKNVITLLLLSLLTVQAFAANEIQAATTTGRNLYAVIMSTVGTFWAGTSTTLEAWNSTHWYNGGVAPYYSSIALTEQAGSSGIYFANFPALSAGRYSVLVYQRAGANPAIGDTLVTAGPIDWDGTALITHVTINATVLSTNARALLALPNLAPGTNGGIPTDTTITADVQSGLTAQGFTATVAGRIDAAVSTRMATFTLPTNFSSLAVTVAGAVTLAATQAYNNTGQTTKSSVLLAASDVTGNVPTDLQTIKGQAVTAGAGVTFPAVIGTSTFAAGQNVGTASSVTGNVGGISGVTFPTNFNLLGVDGTGKIGVNNLPATYALSANDESVMGSLFLMIAANKFTVAALSNGPSGSGSDLWATLLSAETTPNTFGTLVKQLQFDGSGYVKSNVSAYAVNLDPASILLNSTAIDGVLTVKQAFALCLSYQTGHSVTTYNAGTLTYTTTYYKASAVTYDTTTRLAVLTTVQSSDGKAPVRTWQFYNLP